MARPPLLSIPAFTCLLICLFTAAAYGRFISDDADNGSPAQTTSSFLRLNTLHAQPDTCEKTYGFMPCTNSAIGNVFLIIVYGYLMFLAATYLSNGSELLLEILGPGLIGGLFLPMLGALPDAMLILVSGLSGGSKTAQSQVSVGMGLLAGSTVMLLTVIWGTCVIVGKCDLQGAVTIDGKDTVGVSLTGSGVSTDIWTSYAAILMVISLVPFLIVQIPQVMHSTSGRHFAVLVALVVSLILLVSYCVYQVFQPWIQRRRLVYAKHKHIISGVLKHLKMRGFDRLFNDDGQPNERVIEKLFEVTDSDGDNYLSSSELKALILGIRFDETNMDEDDAIDKIMNDFDTSGDSRVDYNEFRAGISRWLDEAIKFKSGSHRSCPDDTLQHFTEFHEHTRHEHSLLGNQIDEAGEEDGVENTKWISIKAVLLLLFGTVIAAAFADPLVDAVDSFSIATSIPTFFISFIVLPLATNSSEAVSAIIFASRKNKRSASLTFSEIYGAVTMNNLMCLSVFLGIVYIRELTWDFSSEVLVIFLVCLLMGIFASIRTTFPLWSCLVAFLLYPFSLAIVYVLDYVFDWS